MKKSKKQSNIGLFFLSFAIYIGLGIPCGLLLAHRDIPFNWLSFYVAVVLALLIQTAVHEAGHLIFGLLTGYRFVSYRILNFMWIRQDGKLRLKAYSLAGTAGQCLMAPPDMVDDAFPTVLYNLGGCMVNVLTSVIFLVVFLLCPYVPFLSILLLALSAMGIALALLNGIPLKTNLVPNDGYNALSLHKDPKARRAFWIQMKVMEYAAGGIRLKDMPEEWFTLPAPEDMDNSLTAAMGVFACNRLMDAGRYEEADSLMAQLLEQDAAMADLHRYMLVCDRITLELLGQNRHEVVEAMRTTEQKQFMKKMQNNVGVLRTEYIYSLLAWNDPEKAKKLRDRFEKQAKNYPYPQELIAERELMDLALQKYQQQ